VVAATGVGAGDLVSAGKAGAEFGLPLLWTAALGAVLKFALAEGIARWQLATGTTILEGWTRHFGWPLRLWFLVYLILWTIIVAAALMAACGLAAHALFPFLSVNAWAVLHGVAALLFVLLEGYGPFERVMKWAVAAMFVAIIGSAFFQLPRLDVLLRGLVIPSVPEGSTILIMGAVGGVGGTLTLLSYSYWMKEKGWSGRGWMRGARFDLGVGYVLTGLFGVAIVLLAGTILHPRGIRIEGSDGILDMAGILGETLGRTGEILFLAGFWAAVATSILGVWQGVPYLFSHLVMLMRSDGSSSEASTSDASSLDESTSEASLTDASSVRMPSTRGRLYRSYGLFITSPPMLVLLVGKPVWIVVIYAAVGSIFMPFLAVTLLILNNRRDRVGSLGNGILSNGALTLCLLLFAYLAFAQIRTLLT
jgi:Mn2+/Fe2+ NRAMP family transporter